MGGFLRGGQPRHWRRLTVLTAHGTLRRPPTCSAENYKIGVSVLSLGFAAVHSSRIQPRGAAWQMSCLGSSSHAGKKHVCSFHSAWRSSWDTSSTFRLTLY